MNDEIGNMHAYSIKWSECCVFSQTKMSRNSLLGEMSMMTYDARHAKTREGT
jgi:hypothetical protein